MPDGPRAERNQLEKQSWIVCYRYTKTYPINQIVKLQRVVEAIVENMEQDKELNLDIHTDSEIERHADAFVGGAPQFNDLAMLCFALKGDCGAKITLDATTENVAAAVAFVSDLAHSAPFTEKAIFQLEVAIDEIVCNIAEYAYEGRQGQCTLQVERDGEGMTITVTDNGIPYDPLQKEDPDVTLPVEARGIGGYGIFLAKKLTDGITYAYKDQTNILKIRKNFNL